MNAVRAWGLGFVCCGAAVALLAGCDDGASGARDGGGVADGPIGGDGPLDGADAAPMPDAAPPRDIGPDPPDADPPPDLGADLAPPGDAGPDADAPDAAPMCGPERCNGLDDDCDGVTDEELAAAPCYDGPPATRGVGACRDGRTACVDGVEVCEGAVLPAAERCDGRDHDCDGTFPAVDVRFDERGSAGSMLDERGLAVADIDVDGDLDFVVGSSGLGDAGALWYANDGAGAFGPANALPTIEYFGASRLALAVGELIGNDRPDLVLLVGSERVLYPNVASGRDPRPLAPEVGGREGIAVAVEDVDADGAPDLLFSMLDQGLYILRGGAGGLGPAVPVALPGVARAILVRDLDGDGAVDVLLPTFGPDGMLLLRGGPDGPAGPPEVVGDAAAGESNDAYLLLDLDGDGGLDLVFTDAHDTLRRAPLLPGPVIGQGPRLAFDGSIQGVAAGQFDCDPALELVVSTLRDTWIVDDPIALDGLRALGGGSGAPGLAVADLDGDGLDDIVHASVGGTGPLVRLQRR